jgi:hypothetical protein
MRRVKSRWYDKSIWKEVRGVFHQWGLELAENSSEMQSYTVALIEDREECVGQIRKCLPEDVIFED